MQGNPPKDLHVERIQTQNPLGPFPGYGESFRQQVIQSLTLLQTVAEFRSLGLQLLIRKRGHFICMAFNLCSNFFKALQLSFVSVI